MPLRDDVAKMYLQEELSDIRFRLDDGPVIPAHKVVCGARSEVFLRMLTGGFREAAEGEIKVSGVDRSAFLEFLRFVYAETVELTMDNVLRVESLGAQYMVLELCDECSRFWKEQISSDSVCRLLSQGIEFGNQSVTDACERFMICNGGEVVRSNPGSTLSAAGCKRFVGLDGLCAPEIEVFEFCLRWASTHGDHRKEAFEEVLPEIRFPLLSYETLSTHVADAGVLADADLIAIMKHKATGGKQTCRFSDQPRVPEGSSFAKWFVYQNDFDENGVIFWLGTQRGTASFSNPHDLGHVIATSSAQLFVGSIQNIVSRGSQYTRMGDTPNSWFAVDLQNRRLQVSKYTIRHGREDASHFMRSWVLEGHVPSVVDQTYEGNDWIELDRRENDESLKRGFGTASWDVTSDVYVRRVRVRMIGPTNVDTHYFHCSGLELYGLLLEDISPIQERQSLKGDPKSPTRELSAVEPVTLPA